MLIVLSFKILFVIDIPPDWKVYKQNPEEMFNPGTIVYYGRAELKTSDHR